MVTSLEELCNLFDRYEVVETKSQIDKEYYTVSENIYSDGDVKTNVTSEGYIHITEVYNATFVIFIDLEHHIYLCVYKYIPENEYKYIKQKLQILKNKINKSNDINNIYDDDEMETNIYINDDVIDINTFTCDECNSNEKMVFTRSKTNPDALETKCSKCKAEFTFVPSKYYKLSSKRIIYFKSEKSSRQINLTENKEADKPKATADNGRKVANTITVKDVN